MDPSLKRYLAESSVDVERALVAKAASIDGRKVDKQLVHGVPHVEIVRLARELPAEMGVIGTHGRTGFARFLIGSVAERVVRTSPVPVLTVPHLEHAKDAVA